METGVRSADLARVAVFAKAPVAGEVKTRLVPLLGAEGAARLHAALVRHALRTAAAAGGKVALWCAPDARHPFFAQCAAEFGVALRVQQGADLGERMLRAFADAAARGEALVLIGADCPALDAGVLRAAAQALASHDAAIVPAEDGGYALIALRRPVPALFEGVPWGAGEVMALTRRRIAAAGLSCREFPALWDVDRPEDYARLRDSGLLEGIGP